MHVRYYVTEIVDVQLKRPQRSERLCATDNKHHSVTYQTATLTTRRTFELKHVHSVTILIWRLIRAAAAELGCLRCANSQRRVHRRRGKCR
jgi:hypothetical protein